MNPFSLADDAAYREWREAKLAAHPARAAELVVEVRDPRSPSGAERAALLDRVRRCNMALYASPCTEPDKDLPRSLGLHLGLERLDANWLADEDGISSITPSEGGTRGEFIPYTDRPIRWHTDGYYNAPQRQIRAVILHCVQSAAEGGENRLLDHEIAYILLRDADPELVRALHAPDAMTIPPREDGDGAVRPAQPGPVFSLLPGGALHMRYTARSVSIEWSAAARQAAARLRALLDSELPWIFRLRLEPGMGLACNNVLHDRAGFREGPGRRRLLYRARYYDRIAGTALADTWLPARATAAAG